ncbi:MAG: pyrophosphohydrolase [Candidatus Handelsmanbacteria bacterium RIFCSPLOWO2_12_FULL_64_10]|uniref:Pyrophosphohydrolase n=1 Tax=Handelsmanbacteria sp. (strain RIFCSPLOWO2_12_FULL_64_10) TaxID=1817868 RepID=A0A1F6CV70_HANXR|nr:MAG: pyrophosphohydrolase [Candidatus Handelsmanbacteria bacterium RIFCSPLOWO2_12_FULL_64_10]
MELKNLQETIRAAYHDRDAARGRDKTFLWFVEEVGELAEAIREENPAAQREEFGDVLAWLATLANLCDIDLTDAMRRYSAGCPRCADSPCACPIR